MIRTQADVLCMSKLDVFVYHFDFMNTDDGSHVTQISQQHMENVHCPPLLTSNEFLQLN